MAEVIRALTCPRDVVLDPFMGGGTTLVEALASGRLAVGADVSSLAAFLAEVKTKIYNDAQIAILKKWSIAVGNFINMNRISVYPEDWVELGYLRHLERRETWRITKAIQQALESVGRFDCEQTEAFARCAILRTAQWALDSRKELPSLDQFRTQLEKYTTEMIEGALEFRRAVKVEFDGHPPNPVCVNQPAEEFCNGKTWKHARPALVLTSPPYPGVHVLYHRWQVDGRKETPAPFWIANKLDGAGGKFYTMGDRKEAGLQSYFDNLRKSFAAVRDVCSPSTVIVQVVAFSSPEWQLPRYLKTMEEVGFDEMLLPGSDVHTDGRLWRTVPNRRWHANRKGETHGSREVVLFHQPSTVKQLLPHSPKLGPSPRPQAH